MLQKRLLGLERIAVRVVGAAQSARRPTRSSLWPSPLQGAAGESATAFSVPMPIVPPGKHHRRLAESVLYIHKLGDQAGRDGSHEYGRVRMDAYSGLSAHWDGHSLDWYVAVQ